MRKKILIVDDDDAILKLLKNVFEKKYTVYTAYDGVEALCYFSEKMVPDLIITDLSMQNIDGYDLVTHLSSSLIYNRIPMIVLSGTPRHDLENIGGSIEVDVLPKPFDPLLLLKVVESALATGAGHEFGDLSFTKVRTNPSTLSI